MPTTTIQGLPYPALTDAPNGPAQFQALAQAFEARLVMVFASASARDTAIGAPTAGMFCWLTTPGQWSFYDGAAWYSQPRVRLVADIPTMMALTSPHAGDLCIPQDTFEPWVYNGTVWTTQGRGVVGFSVNTTNSATWTGTTDVGVQNIGSVQFYAGRRYKITSYAPVGDNAGNTGGDLCIMKHKLGGTTGTVKNSFQHLTTSAVGGLTPDSFMFETWIDDATTQATSVTLTGSNLSGTGGHQIIVDTNAATLKRPYIMVEDLGALV